MPSNHPTACFRTLCPDFFGSSNHPTVNFLTICTDFWGGYPTIQQGFLHTYHTGPVCHPSIQPSNGLFFNTMSRFFWGHPIIQWVIFNIYHSGPVKHPSIQPSNGQFFKTMSLIFGSSNHPMDDFKHISFRTS